MSISGVMFALQYVLFYSSCWAVGSLHPLLNNKLRNKYCEIPVD